MLSHNSLRILARLALIAIILASLIWSIPPSQTPTPGEIANGTTRQVLALGGDLVNHPQLLWYVAKYPQEREWLIDHLSEGFTSGEPWLQHKDLLLDLLSDEQTFLLLSRNAWVMELVGASLREDPSIIRRLVARRILLNQILKWVSEHGEYRGDLFDYPQLLLILQNRGLSSGVLESWIRVRSPESLSLLPPNASIFVQAYSPYAIENVSVRWHGWGGENDIRDTPAFAVQQSGEATYSTSWNTSSLADGLYVIEATASLQHKGEIHDYVPVYLSRFKSTFSLSTGAKEFETISEEGMLAIPSSLVDIPLPATTASPKISQYTREGNGSYAGIAVTGKAHLESNATVNEGSSGAWVTGNVTLESPAAEYAFTGTFGAYLSSNGLEGTMAADGSGFYTNTTLSGRLQASPQDLLDGIQRGTVNLHFTGSVSSNQIAIAASSPQAPVHLELLVENGPHFRVIGDNNGTDGLSQIQLPISSATVTVSASGRVGEFLTVSGIQRTVKDENRSIELELQLTLPQTLHVQSGGVKTATVTVEGQFT